MKILFTKTFRTQYSNLLFIILAYAVFAIGGSLYWAAIPMLSQDVFLLSTVHTGLLVSLIGVIYVITDGPIGIILDHIGYKRGSVFALFFASITAIISLFTPSLPVFLFGLVSYAIAWNMLTCATSAYLLYSVPKDIEGTIFGAYGSIYSFGVLVATFFIGFVLQWGFTKVGLFFLLFIIISLFLILFFVRSEKRKYDKSLMQGIRSYWCGRSQWSLGWQVMKEFKPLSWISVLDGFSGYLLSSIIWFVIPLSLAKFSHPLLPEGAALSFYEFSGVIFIGVGGYLADHFDKKKLYLMLLLSLGIVIVGMGFTSNIFLFLFLFFIASALRDASNTPLSAMVADVDKKHDKDATFYGFTGIFTDLGFIIGPIAAGILLAHFGLRGVFVFLGSLILINWLCAKILLSHSEIKKTGMQLHRKSHLGGMPRHHR